MSQNKASSPAPVANVTGGEASHFAAQVGKHLPSQPVSPVKRCPLCNGQLAEDDGFMRCGGRCGRRWLANGPGRWLDPGTLPFGVCHNCRPRVALVAAEVGAVCPTCRVEYLVLPEGVRSLVEAAPWGICRCCLPPQPLIEVKGSLVCRNKPQQHYQVEQTAQGKEVVWIGLAPSADLATVTAAIDAALSANSAELTLFGLFAPPTNQG